MSAQELQEYLAQVFVEADVDGSGALSYKEFKTVLKTASLGLTKEEIRRLLMEGDENDDGTIDYNEFLPIGIDIVQSIYAKKEAHAAQKKENEDSEIAARTALLHGMTKQQYSDLLLAYFNAHAGEEGSLSRPQFKQALKNAEMGLTRHEINVIMAEVDTNQDGVIDLTEFDHVFFEMLVECITQVLANEIRSSDELCTNLLQVFEAADVRSDGLLYKLDVIHLLHQCDLGLTKIQVLAIMSEAQMDKDGNVSYQELAPKAAEMVRSFWEQNADLDRALYLEQNWSPDQIFGQDAQAVYDVALGSFQEFDADRNGTLDKAEFAECLRCTDLLGRPLNNQELNAIMAVVDEDKDGRVSYEEFLNLVLQVMQHFWHEEQYAAQRQQSEWVM